MIMQPVGPSTQDSANDLSVTAGKSVVLDLARPINVLILYATALATEAGPGLFFDDIYGYDRRLERQLGLAPVG